MFAIFFCGGCRTAPPTLKKEETKIQNRIYSLEISVLQLANKAHELGEDFEERGNYSKAKYYYLKSKWAFQLSENLSQEKHPLSDDINESLRRIKEKTESNKDLKYIK